MASARNGSARGCLTGHGGGPLMRSCQARLCREAVVDRGVSGRRADPQMQTTRPFAGAAPVMPRPRSRSPTTEPRRPQAPDPGPAELGNLHARGTPRTARHHARRIGDPAQSREAATPREWSLTVTTADTRIKEHLADSAPARPRDTPARHARLADDLQPETADASSALAPAWRARYSAGRPQSYCGHARTAIRTTRIVGSTLCRRAQHHGAYARICRRARIASSRAYALNGMPLHGIESPSSERTSYGMFTRAVFAGERS